MTELTGDRDLAFIREGSEPLEWRRVLKNISLLKPSQRLNPDTEDRPPLDLEDKEGNPKTTLTAQECQDLAAYLGRNIMILLPRLEHGPETELAIRDIYWFRACSGADDIVSVQEVDIAALEAYAE